MAHFWDSYLGDSEFAVETSAEMPSPSDERSMTVTGESSPFVTIFGLTMSRQTAWVLGLALAALAYLWWKNRAK
jgi:hypothetical protein